MKKMYVKPAIEVVEFCSDVMMLTFSNPAEDGGGDVEAESNDRRGGWGNLWN